MSPALVLPAWADSDEGRALIDQIIVERPDFRVTRGTWIEGGGSRKYNCWNCRAVGKLRQLYKDWLDREDAALTAQYHVTGHWDQDAADAIYGVEDGDQLIERVLRETEGDLAVKALGDGRFQVAA